MKKIYSSNSLKHLSTKLAERLCEPSANLFQKTTIVTQSIGMVEWIKTEMAKQNRVFANYEFLTQNELYRELYYLIFKEPLKGNRDAIRLKLYDILGESDFTTQFQEVAQYYANSKQRRIQLAAKISDLFDQYQIYRPEMIEKWDEGSLTGDDKKAITYPIEEWQQWLWRRLKIEPKSKIYSKIVDQLENQKESIKERFPEITLFGVNTFTEFHLTLIKEVAKWTDVTFYFSLPTGKKDFINDLLVSYGGKARELSQMFDEINFEAYKNESDTLLASIQNNILEDSSESLKRVDDSIQINSCYTPIREVECLYNYLLDLFSKNPNLKPADILVMTPDINTYGPFIKAIFKNAPVKIPFRVSGEPLVNVDSIVAALEQLMTIDEDDLTSERVIGLLELKRIKKLFGINDTANIRAVVNKANIRFGRENRIEDETHYVSWKYGLQKILLGYAMLTDDEYVVDDELTLFPYKDTEASQGYELLKLIAFVERLEVLFDGRKVDRSLSDWKTFLFSDVFEKMVYYDDWDKDERAELNSIYRALSYIDEVDSDFEVPFEVFLEELKQKLFVETRKVEINTGNVTVTSANIVQGLPHKVICMIGINNDIFPGRDRFLGFDLMGEEVFVGDRSKTEADKYLFLDSLLAAKDKFYLSYIGQNVKDNTELPPSVVVDTLLEYIGNDNLVQKHPLHGFSSQYSEANKSLFTYLYNDNIDNDLSGEIASESVTSSGNSMEVSVHDFVRFFEHPVQWYFNNVLGIYYDKSEDSLPEHELFELDNLQKWFVKNNLMNISDSELNDFLEFGKKEGRLPLKNIGKYSIDEIKNKISELKGRFQDLISGKNEKNAIIDQTFGDLRIVGSIDGIYNKEYITYAFSDKPKYKVRANLNAMFLFSEGKIDSSTFICLKKDRLNVKPFSLTKDEAKMNISKLVDFFSKGRREPLLFSPKVARVVDRRYKKENIFNDEVEGGYNNLPPPDLYLKQLYEEGYFDSFDIEEFDKEVYNGSIYNEIKEISRLLHLIDQ